MMVPASWRRPRGRRSVLAAVTAAASFASLSAPPAPAAPIRPGALMFDQSGQVVQLHGLGVFKVGERYYAVGEDKVGKHRDDGTFRAIACYSSTDLATWTRHGDALSLQASGDLGPGRIVERPKVIRNTATGRYVMYMHLDDPSYSDARVGVATSRTPCGPYTYRRGFRPLGRVSRDIGLFVDTDATGYLLSEDRNAPGLRIYRLSADYLSVVADVALVTPNHESPALARVGGRYVLFGSHLTSWDLNDNEYTTATALRGPWSPWATFAPPGTLTHRSQVSTVITVQGSAGTTHVYAGDRWNPRDLGNSGSVWLPLTFDGTTVTMPWRDLWDLDADAGTWVEHHASTTSIIGTQSSKCVDVPDERIDEGAEPQLWPCWGGANQQWTLTDAGAIVGHQSGLCLDAAGHGTSPGTRIVTYHCTGAANQRWTVASDGTIRGAESGLCLDAWAAGSADRTAVRLWTCHGGDNQRWRLEAS